MSTSVWQYRVARTLGRVVTRTAAILTLGQMPPFVSASAVIVRGDRILVVVDSLRGEPVLPGGHLKWSEDPRAAAIREVREETGCTVEPGRLLGVFSGAEWAGEKGIVRIIYEAQVQGGDLTASAEGRPEWMPLADLAASDTRDAALVRLWRESRTQASECSPR